jgi:glycosyl hydrolase family 2
MRCCMTLVLALSALLTTSLAGAAPTPAFIWLEGENPTTTPSITPPKGKPDDQGFATGGWGRTEFISGGKVLSLSIPAEETAQRLGADGAVFGYEFTVEQPGEYAIWARIGYEWTRSPFDWKLADGDWQELPQTEPTIDVVEIARWNELAWIKLGDARLDKGKHTLSFRHKPYTTADGKGNEKRGRILHSLDAVCIMQGEFRPNGHREPGADYKSDQDRLAADSVFELTDDGSNRPAVALTGLWETARWDERDYDPATRLQGPTVLPDLSRLYWYAIDVPHMRRQELLPEHAFSHRFLLRTRVNVPAAMKGRGFVLEFEGFRMIASVFVNGRHCGWSRDFDAMWQCDLTDAVKPGQVNEIVVAIKSEHYAINLDQDANPDEVTRKHGLRARINVPWDMRNHQSIGHLYDMPVANADISPGIRETVRLVAVGETWVEDVFAKPSFREKRLDLEVTVKNGGRQDATVTVGNEVRRWSPDGLGEKAEKTFALHELTVPPGEMIAFSVSEGWADPALYFPDDPNLYTVVTTVRAGGEVIDVKHTRFGFREITWDGGGFYINGVPWQFWADSQQGSSVEAFIRKAHKSGQNVARYANWHMRPWKQGSPSSHYNALDEAGIMVRSSGTFDGMLAQYGPGLAQGQGSNRTWNRALFEHAAEQSRAWVRSLRNHPCVLIWSYENEITYINSANLGMSEVVEPGIRWLGEEVMRADPTRPAMVDGGRALRPPEEWRNAPPEVVALGQLPVNGCHYNEQSGGVTLRDYPDAAYTNAYLLNSRNRGKWPMAPDRPIAHGEVFFANGFQPAQLAQLGGEECFIGPGETWPARDLMQRMLFEGMRWSNASHLMHTSTGRSTRDYWHSWSPVAVFVREWDRCFGSGSTVERTLKLVNSTSKDSPIDVEWKAVVAGREIAKGTRTFQLQPGGRSDPFTIRLPIPAVSELTSGELVLIARRDGEKVFQEAKAFSVVATDAADRPGIAKEDLVVLDPSGQAQARLRGRGIPFTEVASVEEIQPRPQALIVGRNAVPESRVADPFWQQLLMAGARIVVLEQDHPLRYQSLPADLDVSDYAGSIAFGEDFSHPALAGLNQDAFFCWQDRQVHRTYRNPYRKATQGARSLVQCDQDLGFSALAECRLKEGTLLLCQLRVGENLAAHPVAQRLFDNMVAYAATYEPVRKSTAVVMPKDSLRTQLLQDTQLDFTPHATVRDALAGGNDILIVDATPDNLASLAKAKDQVDTFTQAGGWLVLWGVTPEGLPDFNTLVGVDHVLRPFLRERVTLAIPRDPLTAGLTLRDVAMDTGERAARHWNVPWAVNDAYTWVVDLRDVAPFMDFPRREQATKLAKEGPQDQNNPLNMFNGFTAQQYWQYIHYLGFQDGKTELTFTLPKTEALEKLSVVPNDHLWQPRTIEVYADDATEPVRLPVEVGAVEQAFDLGSIRATRLKLVLTDLENVNPDRPDHVTGIENLSISVHRSPQWQQKVRPLLNIGGLVAYNLGKGGILLNQLQINETESNPETVAKKRTIVRTVLGNLGAVVGGSRPVVVGTGLDIRPVTLRDDLFNAYNQHRNEPSWFRDRKAPAADLLRLPEGRGKFAGVLYDVPEFTTSVVPSVIMLQGEGSGVDAPEVTGIAVGRKADALFFLHTYHAGRGVQQYENRRRGPGSPPLVLFRYRVHYVDGQHVDVPVRWNEEVSHWLQEDPKPLRFAQVAWTGPVEGRENLVTVVYSMQWRNPRANVEISTIDILPSTEADPERLGAPAVIAISTATAP